MELYGKRIMTAKMFGAYTFGVLLGFLLRKLK